MGKKKEGIQILVDKCTDDMEYVIQLAVQFEVGSNQLWDQIIEKAKGNNQLITKLLNYVDMYYKPERFFEAYDDDSEIGDLMGQVSGTLNKLDNVKEMVIAAENAAQRVNQGIVDQYLEQNALGFKNKTNKCGFCAEYLYKDDRCDPLEPNFFQLEVEESVAEGLPEDQKFEFQEKTQDERRGTTIIGQFFDVANDVANDILDKDDEKDKVPEQEHYFEEIKKPEKEFLNKFVVFKCGHSFHERCIIAQRSKANYQRQQKGKHQMITTESAIAGVPRTRKKRQTGLPLKKKKHYRCLECKKFSIGRVIQ